MKGTTHTSLLLLYDQKLSTSLSPASNRKKRGGSGVPKSPATHQLTDRSRGLPHNSIPLISVGVGNSVECPRTRRLSCSALLMLGEGSELVWTSLLQTTFLNLNTFGLAQFAAGRCGQ